MSSPDLLFYGSKSTAVAPNESGHDGMGGYISADELVSLAAIPPNKLTGVAINKVSGENGAGNGSFSFAHTTGLLTWFPPNDAVGGTPVNVGAGGQFILSGANSNAYIVITVTGGNLPSYDVTESIRLNGVNNLLMDDVQPNEALAGLVNYRSFFLKNGGGGALSMLYPVFDMGLATTKILAGSDYGPSGAIDIQVQDISAWPMSGFFRNITSGGEIIYYSERRGNRLLAGASGRRRRGTSMWAGEPGDVLEAIGPVDIGLEMPNNNKISVILDDTAPPPYTVQFFHPTNQYPAAADFVIPTLAAAAYCGIWLRRETPLNTPELLRQQIRLLFRWN